MDGTDCAFYWLEPCDGRRLNILRRCEERLHQRGALFSVPLAQLAKNTPRSALT